MKMKKIKNFIERHKKKIIIGSILVGGVIVCRIVLKNKEIEGYLEKEGTEILKAFNKEDVDFKFETLEEAIAKFKELDIGKCAAIWSKNPESGLYVVQDLN